MIKDFELLF